MSPVTHFLLSWLAAESAPQLARRERAAIALAGIAPDLDGLGVVVDVLTGGRTELFQEWHHVLLHNLPAMAAAAGLAAWIARPGWRLTVAAMTAGVWLLHLLCDVLGSRGPDGHQWPIQPFLPVHGWEWTWAGQWRLDAWPNAVITVLGIAILVPLALRRGRTPLEIVSLRADAAVLRTIRRRMAPPGRES